MTFILVNIYQLLVQFSTSVVSVQYYPDNGNSTCCLCSCIICLTTRRHIPDDRDLDSDVRIWSLICFGCWILKCESLCAVVVVTLRGRSWGVHRDVTEGLVLWVTDTQAGQEIASRWNCRCDGANNGRFVWSL